MLHGLLTGQVLEAGVIHLPQKTTWTRPHRRDRGCGNQGGPRDSSVGEETGPCHPSACPNPWKCWGGPLRQLRWCLDPVGCQYGARDRTTPSDSAPRASPRATGHKHLTQNDAQQEKSKPRRVPDPRGMGPVPVQQHSEPFQAPGTCRIWSPSRTPWLSAGLPSCTLDTKMPTSLPPASCSPTLLALMKRTTLASALYLPRGRLRSAQRCHARDSTGVTGTVTPTLPRGSSPPAPALLLADAPVLVGISGSGSGTAAVAAVPLHGFQQVCGEGGQVQAAAVAAPLPGQPKYWETRCGSAMAVGQRGHAGAQSPCSALSSPSPT